MTDPIAVREKLRAIMQKHWPAPTRQEDLSDYLACEDAILAAFPILAAPAQSATEEAREICRSTGHYKIHGASSLGTWEVFDEGHIASIAAAITAAEARVREECAKIADKAAADAANDAGIARSEGNIGAEERRLCEREKAEAIAAAIRAGGGR